MAAFASGEAPVLVSTTVIEVGVDVPGGDGDGGARRGALRRLDAPPAAWARRDAADIPGLCLLVSRARRRDSLAAERLAALAATSDGFALAEKDLELRREGDVLGAAQSGGRNSLRLLRVVRDREVIEQARRDAERIVREDPALAQHPALAAAIEEWLDPERAEFLERS